MSKAWVANNAKLYIVTRKDLIPGLQMAQAMHAGFQFFIDHSELAHSWHKNSNYVGVLAADNEEHLVQILKKAQERGLRYSAFCEPDLDNQLTAISLEPCKDAKRVCSSLPLALRDFSFRGS